MAARQTVKSVVQGPIYSNGGEIDLRAAIVSSQSAAVDLGGNLGSHQKFGVPRKSTFFARRLASVAASSKIVFTRKRGLSSPRKIRTIWINHDTFRD